MTLFHCHQQLIACVESSIHRMTWRRECGKEKKCSKQAMEREAGRQRWHSSPVKEQERLEPMRGLRASRQAATEREGCNGETLLAGSLLRSRKWRRGAGRTA